MSLVSYLELVEAAARGSASLQLPHGAMGCPSQPLPTMLASPQGSMLTYIWKATPGRICTLPVARSQKNRSACDALHVFLRLPECRSASGVDVVWGCG
jgi:hypothetical protein